jgi:hypothetical protein
MNVPLSNSPFFARSIESIKGWIFPLYCFECLNSEDIKDVDAEGYLLETHKDKGYTNIYGVCTRHQHKAFSDGWRWEIKYYSYDSPKHIENLRKFKERC